MKKLSIVLCASLLAGISSQALAQVQDVSFTVAPVVGYTQWSKKLNLGDAPYWGIRAGFGFGPLFEIRGLYERSYDLKGKTKDTRPDWAAKWLDKLDDSNADIERLGGELKLNLWSNAVVTPYLTAGGGVMKFTYTGKPVGGLTQDYKEEQIYGAGGLGLKFNMGQRVALSLEGKDLMFNVNGNNRFLTDATNGSKLLHNWTGQASLDIYFGGSTSQPSDAVSRAYKNLYTDGFRGLKFVLEPGVAYVDFANNTGYADQWFVGGSAGVDFSSIFGLRGFYYQATEKPQTLKLNFNDQLAMYGGNFVARLNMPLGLTPSLNIGAGYLDAGKKYVGDGSAVKAESGLFLFGGAGLEIPLHRYVALYGNVNAMLTQRGNPDITEVTNPEQVKVATFYQAGLRFNLGRSARDGRALYENYSQENVNSALAEANEANLQELNKLRAKYDARIQKLNKQLEEAVARQDTASAVRILEEKQRVTASASTTEKKVQQTQNAPRTVTLTTTQFEQLVRRVISDLEKSKTPATNSLSAITSSQLSDLDKILLLNALYHNPQATQFALPAVAPAQPVQQGAAQPDAQQVDANIALVKRLDQVIDRLDAINSNQEATAKATTTVARKASETTTVVAPLAQQTKQHIIVADRDDEGKIQAQEIRVKEAGEPVFTMNRLTPFVGLNFGDQFQVNAGLRAYAQIRQSRFDFVPEFYYGFGSTNGFGINANVHYNLPKSFSANFAPFIGVGLGYNEVGITKRFAPNYIVGARLENVLRGALSFDYTMRGALRNHQIAVGYSLYL